MPTRPPDFNEIRNALLIDITFFFSVYQRPSASKKKSSNTKGSSVFFFFCLAGLLLQRDALASCCLHVCCLSTAASQNTWAATGSLSGVCDGSATLLPNGKVLVCGGIESAYDNEGSVCAEIFDPAAGAWTATHPLINARHDHSAVLLPDGKVLVCGGSNREETLASAEIFDPATGRWTVTGSMSVARYGHKSTLLPDGKVLVCGGLSSSDHVLGSTEIFDPAARSWTKTGALTIPRVFHTATLLPNGKVLVSGGDTGTYRVAEIFDPAAGTWTATGPLAKGRSSHTATLLSNGKVLVSGGDGGAYRVAEIFDSAAGSWTITGSMTISRYFHTATLLPNGKVLVSGGVVSDNTGTTPNALASAEIFDPTSGTWTSTSPLSSGRWGHLATLLPSGRVLINGGSNGSYALLASAEIFSPTYPLSSVTTLRPSSGPLVGGTVVTIIGSFFTGETSVTFGTLPAISFTVDSIAQITATAPCGGAVLGAVDVIVTTPSGSSLPSTGSKFTYFDGVFRVPE